jgi:hypothetical protein
MLRFMQRSNQYAPINAYECAANLKSIFLGTPPFSETVCPVGVFAPAKIVIHVR